MQYKIPLQIENEDVIVAGLSMRQIIIMMVWGGLAYTIFKTLEPRIGPDVALIFAIPILVVGIIIALLKIYEMTFMPFILNMFRLTLNTKERIWSK
jgi:cytochrome c-type biogenesis protein CcmH/NrfF